MRLRIYICLFVALSVMTVALTAGYISVRRDYADLSRKYEETAERTGPAQAGMNEPEQSREAGTEEEDGTGELHASDAFYYVTLDENEVIAYTGDHREICMRTRIDEEELAAALIQELKQGIYLENLPALYEYLENCSS